MKVKNRMNMRAFTILALLTALLMVFSFTPLGTIPIGPLSITLNIIPVAIAAIALGPVGGLIIGCIFGLLSFLQCLSIGVPSGMGITLFGINPFLAFVQRFVPRALDGLLVGLIYNAMRKLFAAHSTKKLTLVFGSIIGIILAAAGALVLSTGLEKNRLAQAEGITEGAEANPGTAFIIFGIIAALVGIALIVLAAVNFFGKKERSSKLMPECFIAGFLSAFLNTAFFMTALVVLFGHTEYVQKLMDGRSFLLFIIAFVGVNALVEMVVSTIISGLVGTALHGARVLPLNKES
ncbi:MAG: ECF transporter S component [Clostridia bacterium]|nr:ECF transporter S component [Clostridia bacterium]